MKMSKKIISMLLVAMMAIGMCVTAFAANESMDNPDVVKDLTPEQKVEFMESLIGNNLVSVAPNTAGTISRITDKKILESAYEQLWVVDAYTYQLDNELKEGKYASFDFVFLFDVSGVESGQVTVKLADDGDFKVADYLNHLVVVCHFNEKTQTWEKMDKLAEIDANGCLTFKFDSYSPIMLTILDVTAADLKDGSAVGIEKTTYTPQQVAAKSPKMGE